jgi:hypothetical protein
MKFVAFWEICSGTRAEIIAKGDVFHDEMKADPTKYGRYLRMQDGSAIGFTMMGHERDSISSSMTRKTRWHVKPHSGRLKFDLDLCPFDRSIMHGR